MSPIVRQHRLRSWLHLYAEIKAGRKLSDVRKDDRDYKVGDVCVLQEYDHVNGVYTGEEIKVEITHIIGRATPCAFSSAVLQEGYVILSLKVAA